MEVDIKCMECGRGTRNFELGKIFYDLDDDNSIILAKDKIICPKCRKDISNKKCMVKSHELFMKLFTASICRTTWMPTPKHLKNAIQVKNLETKKNKLQFESVLNLVKKFRR